MNSDKSWSRILGDLSEHFSNNSATAVLDSALIATLSPVIFLSYPNA